MRFLAPTVAAEARAEREDHVPTSAAPPSVAGPTIDGLALDDIDLSDLDVWADGVPHAWLAKLRRDAPLRWQDEAGGNGYWSLTRYDDIVAVSKDYATFSSETGGPRSRI